MKIIDDIVSCPTDIRMTVFYLRVFNNGAALRTIAAVILFALSLGISPQTAGAAADETFREDGRLEFYHEKKSSLISISIEIADTVNERKTGLMGRKGMSETRGVLFVHDRIDDRVFWMRNTWLSLDILFVSETMNVINIERNTTPLSDELYRSERPARYVIEVNAGFCERHGIKKGTRVRWWEKQQ